MVSLEDLLPHMVGGAAIRQGRGLQRYRSDVGAADIILDRTWIFDERALRNIDPRRSTMRDPMTVDGSFSKNHVLDRALRNPHLALSIKKRTPMGPKPTCLPWQGGRRESGMRPRRRGNQEGRLVLLRQLTEDFLCPIPNNRCWRSTPSLPGEPKNSA
jgi:hypothetical protein